MATNTLSNVAAELNLSLMQGKYWSTRMTLTDAGGSPVDVTGYAFRGHVRRTPTNALVAEFAFVVLDAPGGVVRVELLSEQTAQLSVPHYLYDWEYADADGEEHALVKGSISVVAEVTHA